MVSPKLLCYAHGEGAQRSTSRRDFHEIIGSLDVAERPVP
jgi:hypothetical protein